MEQLRDIFCQCWLFTVTRIANIDKNSNMVVRFFLQPLEQSVSIFTCQLIHFTCWLSFTSYIHLPNALKSIIPNSVVSYITC